MHCDEHFQSGSNAAQCLINLSRECAPKISIQLEKCGDTLPLRSTYYSIDIVSLDWSEYFSWIFGSFFRLDDGNNCIDFLLTVYAAQKENLRANRQIGPFFGDTLDFDELADYSRLI